MVNYSYSISLFILYISLSIYIVDTTFPQEYIQRFFNSLEETQQQFRIGSCFHFDNISIYDQICHSPSQSLLYNDLDSAIQTCYVSIQQYVRQALSISVNESQVTSLIQKQVFASYNQSLTYISSVTPPMDIFIAISDALNYCGTKAISYYDKELLWHASLSLNPRNIYSIINYNFELEWHGFTKSALDLYKECLLLTRDEGCLIHFVFTTSAYFMNDKSDYSFNRILHSGGNLMIILEEISSKRLDMSQTNYHLQLRQYQINYQYLGLQSNIISWLYNDITMRLFPNISNNNLILPNDDSIDFNSNKKRIGIVSEHDENSSPGICFFQILMYISQFASSEIELIYFSRKDTISSIPYILSTHGIHVIELDFMDIDQSALVIRSYAPDVLMYLALPTEKFTMILSMKRLAPIQIQFGIGHPISSGSAQMDYFIVGSNMIQDNIRVTGASIVSDESMYRNCIQNYSNACSQSYIIREQLVVFDTLGKFIELRVFYIHDSCIGYYLTDSIRLLDTNDRFDPLTWINDDNVLSDFLISVGLFPKVSSKIIYTNQYHFYIYFQPPKKMHISFDRILLDILALDSLALIILDTRCRRVILPRLESLNSQRFHINDLDDKLLFIDRMPHALFLRLLSFSNNMVFLTPFGIGAGITSSDALSVCTPIIVLPSLISNIQLTFAQVSQFNESLAKEMIATNETDCVMKALKLASSDSIRQAICTQKHLLFGDYLIGSVGNEWISFLSLI